MHDGRCNAMGPRRSSQLHAITFRAVPFLAASLLAVSTAAAAPKAYVIVERLSTNGPEEIQKQYGEASKEIVKRFGGRYLVRSQGNELLEGPGQAPGRIAILDFPSVAAARSWFASPANQEAAQLRRSGTTFRIVEVPGIEATD